MKNIDQNRQYLESLQKEKLIEKALEFWAHRNKLIKYTDALEKRLEELDPSFLDKAQEEMANEVD